jgi:uncharacterized membrane protein YphA (DoxX/SURF4 family)
LSVRDLNHDGYDRDDTELVPSSALTPSRAVNRRSDHLRGIPHRSLWFSEGGGPKNTHWRIPMTVIAVFAVLVIIGDAISMGICTIVERISEHASLIAFLFLFAAVFVVAWKLAVYITERYLMTPEQH